MEAITIASHELRADAGLSKLNSMLGSFCDRSRSCSPSRKGDPRATVIQPGSVDMLGPTARHLPVLRAHEELEAGRPLRSGHCYVLPRKEVIQPQLPLRLPCSRGSPCRHEAWTISSSWLPAVLERATNRLRFLGCPEGLQAPEALVARSSACSL
jgi:hypothetical protein